MELWSVEDASRLWGVTPARARSILSARNIKRVSGYPADAIRAVTRRQGARSDLTRQTTALTMHDTAAAIAEHDNDATKLRIFFEFSRGADESGVAALPLITSEPALTGDTRFDALMAAEAEHIASRYGLPGPLWTATTDRTLNRAWWISELPSARTSALIWTPAAFRRRAIYLDRTDLTHDGVTPVSAPLFDATELHRAFTKLAEKLQRRNTVGHVHVFGGAAMILAYNPERAATRDIDAVFTPDGPMIAAIREIATENHWPTTWLNNQAAMYAARQPGQGARVFDHPHLQVMATPPEHLLAMKVLAARAVRDADDLRFLINHLNITTTEEILATVHRYFPNTDIPTRSRALIEDILWFPRDRGGFLKPLPALAWFA
ncbi:hypothetical protein [Mycolicibacterium goodii]|uniref:hypothetical protein n=1 Tax=Mycolicibacterium goodii TaxID=134601 RepID=UPI0027E1407D|nr:hypothetical protein [Mycolicibacterium goodii]